MHTTAQPWRGFMECRGLSAASLISLWLGWKVWQSTKTCQALLHLQRGGKEAHGASLLLKCSMCSALQTGINLPRGDGTGPGGVWQQNGDFNSCLLLKMSKSKADIIDLMQRGSLYLSGVRSFSSSEIFFFPGDLLPWGPHKQAEISDFSTEKYFWMYWSKLRGRTVNVSVFECTPKGKIILLTAVPLLHRKVPRVILLQGEKFLSFLLFGY